MGASAGSGSASESRSLTSLSESSALGYADGPHRWTAQMGHKQNNGSGLNPSHAIARRLLAACICLWHLVCAALRARAEQGRRKCTAHTHAHVDVDVDAVGHMHACTTSRMHHRRCGCGCG